MNILDAIILGVVQGLTEFLPVSSSGHLILARELFGVGIEGGLAFDAALHFATACAVIMYFRADIVVLVQSCFRFIMRHEDSADGKAMMWGIALATIPAFALGLLLESVMETVFRNGSLVAGTLVAGSVIMYAAEKWVSVDTKSQVPTLRTAFRIGLFQSLALIPGMSRSGMAIAGGMFLGLSREASARFAFLIAVPLMLGAGLKKIIDLGAEGLAAEGNILAAGMITAFLVGVFVIHYLMQFLRTNSLTVFIWYRMILAMLVLGSIWLVPHS
ncbi:MAG: undecaprenyl-diphosphatase UppP [Patescibacteria group bacterium]